MPQLPADNPLNLPLDGGDLPVASIADVQNEFAGEIQDPPVAPLRDAIQGGIKATLEAYQNASSNAAAQNDPLRAEDAYLDEIGSYERDIHRQAGEGNGPYGTRVNAFENVVDPDDIIAAANAVLAPYTSVSAVYFEHLDCWHVGSGPYWDIVAASNTAPILIQTRCPLDPVFTSGGTAVVANVAGNTAANGTFPIQIVAGPVVQPPASHASPVVSLTGTPATGASLQITITTGGTLSTGKFTWQVGSGTPSAPLPLSPSVPLPGTGLTVNFAAGTYVAGAIYSSVPTSFTLTGSNGTASGVYSGGGSVSLTANQTPWSSHVYSPYQLTNVSGGVGTSRDGFPCQALPVPPFDETPNYPDRLYPQIAGRKPMGARAFSNAYGRIFWLLVPDISTIDNNVLPLYTGQLDIVDASNTTPIQIRTRFPLPPEVQTNNEVIIQNVRGNIAANGLQTITVTGTNIFQLQGTVGSGFYIDSGSVQLFTTIYDNSGFFAFDGTEPLNSPLGAFAWSIQATSSDVYNSIVSAVEALRGQSVRWWLYADPKLGF